MLFHHRLMPTGKNILLQSKHETSPEYIDKSITASTACTCTHCMTPPCPNTTHAVSRVARCALQPHPVAMLFSTLETAMERCQPANQASHAGQSSAYAARPRRRPENRVSGTLSPARLHLWACRIAWRKVNYRVGKKETKARRMSLRLFSLSCYYSD